MDLDASFYLYRYCAKIHDTAKLHADDFHITIDATKRIFIGMDDVFNASMNEYVC